MIDINEFAEEYVTGYIFPLAKCSEIDCEFIDSESSVVILKKGLGYIFVLSKNRDKDPSKSYLIANESATKSLDILSMKGLFSSNIKSPTPHYIKWIKTKSGSTLEITEQSQTSISSRSTSYPTFSNDNYNDCFRFYRLAQISSDIFDSYRNLWLCFEWLLSDKYPVKSHEHEKEIPWIKRAFTEFIKLLADEDELSKLLKTINANALIDTLYKETRLQLFHAKTKSNKKYLLPNKLEDMEKVRKSLNMLTIVVNSMIGRYFDNRPHNSWINPIAFIDPYKELFNDLIVYISNIKINGVLDEQAFKDQSDNLDFAPCIYSVEKHSDHIGHKFMAKIDTSNSGQTVVSRFSQISKTGEELLVFTLDDELSLKGVKSIDFISILKMSFNERVKTYNYRI